MGLLKFGFSQLWSGKKIFGRRIKKDRNRGVGKEGRDTLLAMPASVNLAKGE